MLPRSFLALLAFSFSLAAAPSHLMLVVSKGLPGATIYDADTQQPVCSAKLGISPHEAAFSLDGHMAYVPVYGSSSVGLPGTDEHTLHFIRTSDCKEIAVLDTGDNKRPHGIAVGASGRIYLTTETTATIQIIDPDTHAIVGSVPTGSKTSHILAVSPDEKTIYTSNVMSKTISVIDVAKREVSQIPTVSENQRMTISPDRQWFVTSFGPEHKVAFYRTSDRQLDFTVPVDGVPFVAKFSQDGKYLYDAGTASGEIRAWKIDVGKREVVAQTSEEIGKGGVGTLTVDPFNERVFISSAAANRISEIDPRSWKIVDRISTEKTPDAILFTAVQ